MTHRSLNPSGTVTSSSRLEASGENKEKRSTLPPVSSEMPQKITMKMVGGVEIPQELVTRARDEARNIAGQMNHHGDSFPEEHPDSQYQGYKLWEVKGGRFEVEYIFKYAPKSLFISVDTGKITHARHFVTKDVRTHRNSDPEKQEVVDFYRRGTNEDPEENLNQPESPGPILLTARYERRKGSTIKLPSKE